MQTYTKSELNLYVGSHLTFSMKERDALSELHDYIISPNDRKTCCLDGLQYTGKTTMMLQEIRNLSAYAETVLINCEDGDDMLDLKGAVYQSVWNEVDIERFPDGGSLIRPKGGRTDVKYIFIDNVTRIKGFAKRCSFLADDIAMMGIKVVFAGENLFDIYEAYGCELYDRVHLLDINYVPFTEYQRLLDKGLDEYISNGGVLYRHVSTFDYSNIIDFSLLLKIGYFVATPNGYTTVQADGLLNRVVLQIVNDMQKAKRSFVKTEHKSIIEFPIMFECNTMRYHKKQTDIVLYDGRKKTTLFINVSESDKPQRTSLNNKEYIDRVEAHLNAPITSKAVIYMGENIVDEDGVIYINAADFLSRSYEMITNLLYPTTKE